MRKLVEMLQREVPADATLTLAYEKRQRSRMRVRLDNGDDASIVLQRGTLLRDGDRLGSKEGFVVEIKSAPETVSTVHSGDPQTLATVAYHLGNRHVKLQIGENWVRYLHDHVLDEMVHNLGLVAVTEQAAFEPESGAYGGAHAHTHD